MLAAAALIIGVALVLIVGGAPKPSDPVTGVTVITPSVSGAPATATATPADPFTTVVAAPLTPGSGATTDVCGLRPSAQTTVLLFFHGTNARALCAAEVGHGWVEYAGTSVGSRTELCGMTDGTAASEDLIDVFDSGAYTDGIRTCHALQTADWGPSAFWPVLEGLTPAPEGPGLPPDYFG